MELDPQGTMPATMPGGELLPLEKGSAVLWLGMAGSGILPGAQARPLQTGT